MLIQDFHHICCNESYYSDQDRLKLSRNLDEVFSRRLIAMAVQAA